MVKLSHVSDEDLYSIIAWLRSDDPALKASKVKSPEPKPSLLIEFLCMVAWKPFEYPKTAIPEPDKTNEVAWGKYLANSQYSCYACHSADFKTNNDFDPEKSVGFYGGGNLLLDVDGKNEVHTANITMDKKTGIGNWTLEDFITTVKYGRKPNKEPVKYPMEPYAGLDSSEVKAIFAYLKTIPVIEHKVN